MGLLRAAAPESLNGVSDVGRLFELGRDEEFLRFPVVGNVQHVGLAAHLAVFDVALVPAGGFVHRRFVPFSTAGALEAWGQVGILEGRAGFRLEIICRLRWDHNHDLKGLFTGVATVATSQEKATGLAALAGGSYF